MKRKINVYHLIWGLTPGGAEQQLATIVTGLDSEKYRVAVGCLSVRGEVADYLESNGIEVDFIKKRPGADYFGYRRLRALLARRKIDILHTHIFTANLWGRLAGKAAKIPVLISHEHSDFSLEKGTRRIIDRLLAYRTKKIIAVSEDLRKRIIFEEGILPDKVLTIKNGIDWGRMKPRHTRLEMRRALGISGENVLVGIVGALEPRKDHHTFLQAARIAVTLAPELRFLVVGDGPMRDELEKEVLALHIKDFIQFAGLRSDIPDLLRALDIYVSSSTTEGISIALLEAMYMGLPVIATDVGGTPEVVRDDETGLLVPKSNPDIMAEMLVRLAGNPEERRKLGQAGYNLAVNEFSADSMVAKISDLYESCEYLLKK